MSELTLEDKRLLTEFLGECWHIPNHIKENLTIGIADRCLLCDARLPWIRLDFSDWRVVGRLIEKMHDVREQFLEELKSKELASIDAYLFKLYLSLAHKNPQLAICHAVLTYLKEQSHVL